MMNKKIIYSLVALALIFFIGSLIIFLKSNRELRIKENGALIQEQVPEEKKEIATRKLKTFYLTEASRIMVSLDYEVEVPAFEQDLYKKYVDMLLAGSGKADFIAPVPEGASLRSLFYLKDRQLLVLDFNDNLLNNIPGGTTVELEFIYYIVNNICYNFSEIKMVKFIVSGNEYKVLSGHIDIEAPFYPDYRYMKDE